MKELKEIGNRLREHANSLITLSKSIDDINNVQVVALEKKALSEVENQKLHAEISKLNETVSGLEKRVSELQAENEQYEQASAELLRLAERLKEGK